MTTGPVIGASILRKEDRRFLTGRGTYVADIERPGMTFGVFVRSPLRLKVDIIVTYASSPVLAAKQATSVIPIVFAAATDPVGAGLVGSLARPGGNVTGLSL
jgi:putative ABC transport system substrate-binding protein